jgi:hypothetical protein
MLARAERPSIENRRLTHFNNYQIPQRCFKQAQQSGGRIFHHETLRKNSIHSYRCVLVLLGSGTRANGKTDPRVSLYV